MVHRALALGAAILIAVSRPILGQCVSWEAVPGFLRLPAETQLVARVLDGRPWDTLPHPRLPWPGPGHARGRRIAVEQADGPGVPSLGVDSVAVIVLWSADRDDSCEPVRAFDTLAVGTRHVFRATLRPDSLWMDGLPTWDTRADLLADFSLSAAASQSMTLATYRGFLDTLPSREEWAVDCRPGVMRVERWQRAHGVSDGRPFVFVRERLRQACEFSMQQRLRLLERWEPSRPVSVELRAVFREQECRDDQEVFADLEQAVDGSFTESAAPQWVFICAGAEDWRLLAVVLESPPRIIELVRMVGKDWGWLAGTAPAEYFAWASSRELRPGRWSLPRPEGRGVVLLRFISPPADDETLAFFETPQGWMHVGVTCCNWPD